MMVRARNQSQGGDLGQRHRRGEQDAAHRPEERREERAERGSVLASRTTYIAFREFTFAVSGFGSQDGLQCRLAARSPVQIRIRFEPTQYRTQHKLRTTTANANFTGRHGPRRGTAPPLLGAGRGARRRALARPGRRSGDAEPVPLKRSRRARVRAPRPLTCGAASSVAGRPSRAASGARSYHAADIDMAKDEDGGAADTTVGTTVIRRMVPGVGAVLRPVLDVIRRGRVRADAITVLIIPRG